MKVLLVSGSLPEVRCGIGDYTARLATELASRPGMDVTVITSQNDRIHPDAAGSAAVLATGGWGLSGLVGLFRQIRRLGPDLVHVQYPAVGYGRGLGIVFLPLVLRWLGRIPTVLTIHERRERRWSARMAINLMALASNAVVVLDPIEAEDLRRSVPWVSASVITGRMISTIPLVGGVDRRAWRARLGVGHGQVLMVSFGLIHPRRKLELIIDALADLNRDGDEAHLLFVGGEAEYEQGIAHQYAHHLRGKVDELGLGGATHWLDHASARIVSEALQAADVAVLLYPGGASGRNTTLQAVLEHGAALVTTLGPATPDEMRRRLGITFLPEGDQTGHDVADAVRKSARRGAAKAATAREASRIPEHVQFHLDLYRRLLR